jgi:hypothetical protein
MLPAAQMICRLFIVSSFARCWGRPSPCRAIGPHSQRSRVAKLRKVNGSRQVEMRTWLPDGDALIFRAHCGAPDRVVIGFGECLGRVATA